MLSLQSTYIYQYQPGFTVPYSGPNSLLPGPTHGYSFSATGMLAARPWAGGEIYFEPELVSSIPISNLTGLGGLTNGENQKGGGVRPELYVARAFLRQTWNLGGRPVKQVASLTQLPTTVDSRRLVLTVGNYAITDIFDTGNYSGDPRNTFLNWSFLTYGAWDYAADVRGYTWGATLSFHDRNWAVRAGRFLEPVVCRTGGPRRDWSRSLRRLETPLARGANRRMNST
ncbi:MAG: carbohydrate porin [Betaproteobacteria bacterium]|nr:carbohydrate porin [Betaproteobacteria bacterium]